MTRQNIITVLSIKFRRFPVDLCLEIDGVSELNGRSEGLGTRLKADYHEFAFKQF
jgi:hypothetical protein